MSIESFQKNIQEAAELFRSRKYKQITLFHHNDADGLSSGAILQELFEREKITVNRICLEKPYPQIITPLLNNISGDKQAVFFTDFGSGMLKTIQSANVNGVDIYILDHHLIEEIEDDQIVLLNCLAHGISGNRECSASAICALFAVALNKENSDLSSLGITGAFGDGHQDERNLLLGINKLVFDLAKNEGISRTKKGVIVKTGVTELDVLELVDIVNSLGSFGYLLDGPQIAVAILLDGVDDDAKEFAISLRQEFQEKYAELCRNLQLKQSGQLQWFTLPESFHNMGVKTVGLVCEELCKNDLVDPNRYLLGFQKIPSHIPDLEEAEVNGVKVSMRLPKELSQKVDKKEALPLTEILPRATRSVGGFVDACHPHAAASTIEEGKELQLIESIAICLK